MRFDDLHVGFDDLFSEVSVDSSSDLLSLSPCSDILSNAGSGIVDLPPPPLLSGAVSEQKHTTNNISLQLDYQDVASAWAAHCAGRNSNTKVLNCSIFCEKNCSPTEILTFSDQLKSKGTDTTSCPDLEQFCYPEFMNGSSENDPKKYVLKTNERTDTSYDLIQHGPSGSFALDGIYDNQITCDIDLENSIGLCNDGLDDVSDVQLESLPSKKVPQCPRTIPVVEKTQKSINSTQASKRKKRPRLGRRQDKRPRYKGRFVTREELERLLAADAAAESVKYQSLGNFGVQKSHTFSGEEGNLVVPSLEMLAKTNPSQFEIEQVELFAEQNSKSVSMDLPPSTPLSPNLLSKNLRLVPSIL